MLGIQYSDALHESTLKNLSRVGFKCPILKPFRHYSPFIISPTPYWLLFFFSFHLISSWFKSPCSETIWTRFPWVFNLGVESNPWRSTLVFPLSDWLRSHSPPTHTHTYTEWGVEEDRGGERACFYKTSHACRVVLCLRDNGCRWPARCRCGQACNGRLRESTASHGVYFSCLVKADGADSRHRNRDAVGGTYGDGGQKS